MEPVKLHYKKYGEQGPHLVVVHGLFGMLDNWQTLCRRWSEDYQVWAVDLRNHGKSPHHDVHTYEAMAKDLLHFFETHDLDDFYLLGHSMGGKAVMQYALDHPEKLRKLIVADIAPKAYDGKHDEILDALSDVNPSDFTSRNEADEVLSKAIPSYAVRQFLLKNLSRDDNGYRWKFNLPVLEAQYDNITGGVSGSEPFKKPALFIRGQKSSYIQDEDRDDIDRLFPDSYLVTIPDAGHWVHAEAPDAFYQTVKSFLEAGKKG